MKNTLILSLGVMTCLMLSSCYKEWTCDCKLGVTYDSTYTGTKNYRHEYGENFSNSAFSSRNKTRKECDKTKKGLEPYIDGAQYTADCKLK